MPRFPPAALMRMVGVENSEDVSANTRAKAVSSETSQAWARRRSAAESAVVVGREARMLARESARGMVLPRPRMMTLAPAVSRAAAKAEPMTPVRR